MIMNEKDIRKYASLMSELGLTGIEITEGGASIRLERSPAPETRAAMTVVEAAQDCAQAETLPADVVSVRSPIVGVFYASPAENAEPYVSVGDRVEKGKTLCIIEAMKLMNEINAEFDGVVTEVCVKNGQVVEYGTELFRMKR